MDTFLEPDTIYFIVGIQDRMTEQALFQFKKNSRSHYVFIDYPDKVLAHKSLPENVEVTAFSGDLAADLARYASKIVDKELVWVPHEANQYEEICVQIEDALERLKFELSATAEYALFADNAILNANDLKAPLIQYSDACEGQTAIVLGAAPSLEQHLAWIKQHQTKLVIFAVARLAKRLYQEGITPDFLIATDPTRATIAHASKIEQFQQDAVLVIQHYANHGLVDRWMGETLYWGPALPHLSGDFVPPKNVEINGGTVTNFAVLTALGLGCKQIYISGMDLCFSDLNRTHEKSSLESRQAQTFYAPETVETYRNQKAATTIEFKNAIEALPRQIESLVQDYGLQKDFKVFQLCEDAAKIDYINFLEINQAVVPKIEKPSTPDLIERIRQEMIPADKRMQQTTAQLHKSMKLYRTIEKQVKQLQAQLTGFDATAMNLPGAVNDLVNCVTKPEKKLIKTAAPQNKFIQRYGYRKFAQVAVLADQLHSHTENYGVILFKYYQAFCQAYLRTLARLSEVHSQAIALAKFKQQEALLSDDFNQLYALWEMHDRLYRCLPWAQLHQAEMLNWDENTHKNYQACLAQIGEFEQAQIQLAQKTMAHFSHSSVQRTP